MLAGILGLVILFIKLFPKTPFGRLLHYGFVELPLSLAYRLERKHIILIVVILCAGQSLALLGSAELAMAYAVDMSIYADAVLATTIASAVTRLKGPWWAFKDGLVRLVGGLSRPRLRSRSTKSAILRSNKTSNDNDPDGAWLAYAA